MARRLEKPTLYYKPQLLQVVTHNGLETFCLPVIYTIANETILLFSSYCLEEYIDLNWMVFGISWELNSFNKIHRTNVLCVLQKSICIFALLLLNFFQNW